MNTEITYTSNVDCSVIYEHDEDGNTREVRMWTSPQRLYWTADRKLTTEARPNGALLSLACRAGGRVPLAAARDSGLLGKEGNDGPSKRK